MGFVTSVRNASPSNLDAVIAVLIAAGLPVDDVDSFFGESFAVAIVNDSIVGTAAVETRGDVGLFRSVGVRGDLRGKGIGEALTRNRIEWAIAHGLHALYLLTTSASKYFPRFGFEIISREQAPREIQESLQFTALCPGSATVMRMDLTACMESLGATGYAGKLARTEMKRTG